MTEVPEHLAEAVATVRAFAAAAAAERQAVATALRRAGAEHVVLSTEGDWLRTFAGHLRRSELAVRRTHAGSGR